MQEFDFTKQSEVFVSQQIANRYTLYLNEQISNIDQFADHIAVFQNALPDDVIFLHCSSNGGSTAVGEDYIFQMHNCRAPIIGVVGMGVASMASAIMLECTDLVITDMSTMLVHSFGYGNQTHAPGMFSCADFNNKLNIKWLDKYFGLFLTPEEREDCLKGVDLQFDADQIRERWEAIMELRENEYSTNELQEEAGETFNLLDEIDKRVAEGVEKALGKVLSKYDLTPKVKPARAKPAKKEVVDSPVKDN